jgi:hypothetical protein
MIEYFLSVEDYAKPKANLPAKKKETEMLKLNFNYDPVSKSLVVDLNSLPFENIFIKGLKKIHFQDSLIISSDKHIGINSGFQNSHNYYKVLVNSEFLEGEELDQYNERIMNSPRYIRKYPKRPYKMRKQLHLNRFTHHDCQH